MIPRDAPSPSSVAPQDERFTQRAARLAGQAGVVFGWCPDTFWRATPAELAALTAAVGSDAVAAPVDLAALMKEFPDER